MSITQLDEFNNKKLSKSKKVLALLNSIETIEDTFKEVSFGHISKELHGLAEKFSRDTINISVVSEVSSGKSTFLNALLFNEVVLESKLGETTAKIFKIKYGEKHSIDGQEVDDLQSLKASISRANLKNLEEIGKGQAVKQIQSTITLPNKNLKRGIELYDTPGFATINESSMLTLIREAIVASDATILLLNIAQGIKKSEEHFIRDMLHRVAPNKRFIVLNKFDSIMDEDELMLKSKEEIEEELGRVIASIEETLRRLHDQPNEQLYYLSAKKALVGKIHHDEKRLKESRFLDFEEIFWKRMIEAKGELYDDNVLLFKTLKKELKELVTEKSVELRKSIVTQEQRFNEYLQKERHLIEVPKKVEMLIICHEKVTQEKEEGIDSLERRLLRHLKDMLYLNLLSELTSIPLLEKLQFWKLKESYTRSVLTVIDKAEEYIIAEMERFIEKILKREEDKKVTQIIEEIDEILLLENSFTQLYYSQDWGKFIERLKVKIREELEWSNAKQLALLKYGFMKREEEQLFYPHKELDVLVGEIKKALVKELKSSQSSLDDYLFLVTQKEKEIQESLKNKEHLHEKISNLKALNREMESLIETIGDE